MKKKDEINEVYSLYSAMDNTSVILDYGLQPLVDHLANYPDKDAQELLNKAADALAELYQYYGRKFFEADEAMRAKK